MALSLTVIISPGFSSVKSKTTSLLPCPFSCFFFAFRFRNDQKGKHKKNGKQGQSKKGRFHAQILFGKTKPSTGGKKSNPMAFESFHA